MKLRVRIPYLLDSIRVITSSTIILNAGSYPILARWRYEINIHDKNKKKNKKL